jgi:predicted O-linked N-acetylglucosamine transferase (SPINDLY family)
MGAKYYDYLIADKTIIPVKSQVYYSEKIVYLPSYQVNDSKQEISSIALSRQALNYLAAALFTAALMLITRSHRLRLMVG